MADQDVSQPLPEFILNAIDDLKSGAISPEEAYIAMQQYRPLRDLLVSRKADIATSLADTEAAKSLFLEILEKERAIAGKETEALDARRSPAEIAQRAKALLEAEKRTDQAIKNKLPNLEADRKTYARRVAAAWIEQVRKQGREMSLQEDQVTEKILGSTEKLPAAKTAVETRSVVASTLLTAVSLDANLSPHAEALGLVTETVEPPAAVVQAAQIKEQTTRIIVDNADIARPDLLVQFVSQGVETTKAVNLTRVAESLSLDINPAVDVTRPSVFFQAVATTGLQKLAAPAADAILTVLPQETREAVIESVLTKSWARVTEHVDQKLGTAVVSTPLFQEAITQGNKAFGAKPTTPGGAAGGIAGFVSDAFTTVFGTGIDQAMINQYLETGRRTPLEFGRTMGAEGPTWYQFYVAFAAVKSPELFHQSFETGRWALNWVGQKAIGKAAGLAAKAAATKLAGTAIGSVLIPIPVIGGLIGGAISFIGSKVVGGLVNGVKNLLGGGFINRLFSGEPGRWQDDFPLIAAAIVLLPIILLFLLPTFLNPQFVGNTSQASALAQLGGENTEEGGSAYITITKDASPNSFPDNNPGNVTYTITLKASAADLSNIRISDIFSVFGGANTINAPPITGVPSSLSDGEKFSTSINVSLSGLKDSLVTNTVTVTADAKTLNGQSKQGETRSTSASVSIGKPPTGCFAFSDTPTPDAFGHTSSTWDDKSGILKAITELSKSSSYMAQICSKGTVNLYRVYADFAGGSVSSSNGIFLYNAGVRGLSAVYTLAHESGHILDRRTNLFQQFHNNGIAAREGFLWTYPLGMSEREDFAETMADYVVHSYYVFRRRGTKFSFAPYPLHYDFAKGVFGIEY